MRNGIVGSLAVMMLGSGWVWAQPGAPPAYYPGYPTTYPGQPMTGVPGAMPRPGYVPPSMPAWPMYPTPAVGQQRAWPMAAPLAGIALPPGTAPSLRVPGQPPMPQAPPVPNFSLTGQPSATPGTLPLATLPAADTKTGPESPTPTSEGPTTQGAEKLPAPASAPPGPPEPNIAYDPVPGSSLLHQDPPAPWNAHPADDRHPHHAPRGYHVYGSAQFLFWWFKEPEPLPGLLAGNQDGEEHTGTRITVGAWLDCNQHMAVEGSWLFLGERHPTFAITPVDPLTLGRRLTPPAVTLPALASSSGSIENVSRLWSVELNLRKELFRWAGGHLDLLAGARYLELDEAINVSNRFRFVDLPVTFGNATLQAEDGFGADNRFIGGQLGAEIEIQVGKAAYVDLWGKAAVGNNRQRRSIQGATSLQTGNIVQGPPSQFVVGGVLTNAANIGTFERDELTFVPEFGANVGYQINNHVRVSGGYSFLYIDNAVRPSQALGTDGDTSFWTHGVNLEVEFRF
jgi:hypothetical protein